MMTVSMFCMLHDVLCMGFVWQSQCYRMYGTVRILCMALCGFCVQDVMCVAVPQFSMFCMALCGFCVWVLYATGCNMQDVICNFTCYRLCITECNMQFFF
ncbi:unnamed protein product [Camellia sinensis]